jgi:VWFA-related protein
MSRRVFLALGGLVLTAVAALWAQDAEPEPIRVSVTEVMVPVTITDAEGRFVTGLKKENFELYDEGIRQNIRFFAAEGRQPVVVGFLMDLSTSMRTSDWKTFQENATVMISQLMGEGDQRYQGYLVGMSTEAEVMVDTTFNPQSIIDKVNKLTPGGGAALADAIYLACTKRKLVPGEPLDPRRVIIVFGSGLDTSRTHSLDEVIELAKRNSVTIYAVSTDRYGITSPNNKNLRKLAEETGGRVEYPLMSTYKDTAGFLSYSYNGPEGNRAYVSGTGGYTNQILKALTRSVQAIAGDIQQQYILRFVPNTPEVDVPEHRLTVRVNLPNVNVNTRKSYFSQ